MPAQYHTERKEADTVEVYRKEGELDCLMSCLKGTKSGGCPGACAPRMRGCCSSLLTLRQGTMGFAVIQLLSMVINILINLFRDTGNDGEGNSNGISVFGWILFGIFALLAGAAAIGLLGAMQRKGPFVKFFIWAYVIGYILICIVSIILIIGYGAWPLLFFPIIAWITVWWQFVVGKSLVDVLAEGGTGDEHNSENIFIKSMPRDKNRR